MKRRQIAVPAGSPSAPSSSTRVALSILAFSPHQGCRRDVDLGDHDLKIIGSPQ
jgi:hypothetical protein